ncbi:MAG: helix-turn-helix domain-containing protein [Christensenellaceae bacterium]|nr:helix-turn-helix domain-containing protein [Christensenellaceae bacterium]
MCCFQKTFVCCRFVYNRMFADKTLHYDSTKESLYKPQQYKTEFEWLREVDSLAL